MTFRTVGSRRLGRGEFISLDRVHMIGPAGEKIRRDVIRHPGGVGILPLDGGDCIFVRQYRVALDRDLLEIPAGKMAAQTEETEAAARRELLEEIGATAGVMTRLGAILPSPGYTDEIITLYLATDLTFTDPEPDGVEEVHAEIVRIPQGDAIAMVQAGDIGDAKTQAAILLWHSQRGETS